jgi:hypothetical protein
VGNPQVITVRVGKPEVTQAPGLQLEWFTDHAALPAVFIQR